MKRAGDTLARIAGPPLCGPVLIVAFLAFGPAADAQQVTPPAVTSPSLPTAVPSPAPSTPRLPEAAAADDPVATTGPAATTWTQESFDDLMGTLTPEELAALDASLSAAEGGSPPSGAGAATPDQAQPPSAQAASADLTGTEAVAATASTPSSAADPAPSKQDLGAAVQQDARHFGWPLVLAVLVGLFLFFQGQVDRHEPKLADAPLDQGERLRFRS